jgi:hypothetical protein
MIGQLFGHEAPDGSFTERNYHIKRTRSIKKCIFFKAKKQATDVCYRYSNNNVMGISNITNTT